MKRVLLCLTAGSRPARPRCLQKASETFPRKCPSCHGAHDRTANTSAGRSCQSRTSCILSVAADAIVCVASRQAGRRLCSQRWRQGISVRYRFSVRVGTGPRSWGQARTEVGSAPKLGDGVTVTVDVVASIACHPIGAAVRASQQVSKLKIAASSGRSSVLSTSRSIKGPKRPSF